MRRATFWPRTFPRHLRAGCYAVTRTLHSPDFRRFSMGFSGRFERGRREQMAELLAPDDGAREVGRIGARRQVVAERTVGRLELAELERPLREPIGRGREVDEQVGPVADREVLEPEVEPARRRLDDRGGAAAEVEVVGAVERPPVSTRDRRERRRRRRGRRARPSGRATAPPGRSSRPGVGAAAGVELATAPTGAGSTSAVRMKIGDARYQVSGTPTARASAMTTPVRRGMPASRRDPAAPPGDEGRDRRPPTADPIATGMRSSYRALKKAAARSPRASRIGIDRDHAVPT